MLLLSDGDNDGTCRLVAGYITSSIFEIVNNGEIILRPADQSEFAPLLGLGALLGIQKRSTEGDPTWGHPYGRAPLGIMPPHWIILRKNSSKRYFWDNRKTKLNKIDGYYILVPGVVRGLSEATLQPSLHSILPGRSRLAILQ